MKALCTLSRTRSDTWLVRHSSSALGNVEITGPSREEALTKMQNELQYRLELCPCSGSVGTVELQVSEDFSSGQAARTQEAQNAANARRAKALEFRPCTKPLPPSICCRA